MIFNILCDVGNGVGGDTPSSVYPRVARTSYQPAAKSRVWSVWERRLEISQSNKTPVLKWK